MNLPARRRVISVAALLLMAAAWQPLWRFDTHG